MATRNYKPDETAAKGRITRKTIDERAAAAACGHWPAASQEAPISAGRPARTEHSVIPYRPVAAPASAAAPCDIAELVPQMAREIMNHAAGGSGRLSGEATQAWIGHWARLLNSPSSHPGRGAPKRGKRPKAIKERRPSLTLVVDNQPGRPED